VEGAWTVSLSRTTRSWRVRLERTGAAGNAKALVLATLPSPFESRSAARDLLSEALAGESR
jgi:hypothetical protein